jgi:hypothetical protein
MGYLAYGDDKHPIEIEDRALAHLKIAILSLLRANKSVAFSYTRSVSEGSGRETLWLNPMSQIRFHFNGSRPPRINDAWVRAILATASASTGLLLIPETEAIAIRPILTATSDDRQPEDPAARVLQH